MSPLILVAITPTEWQSVSDAHSDKESNVTQMLYSSSPSQLMEKAKQTSSTATFNQTQPYWWLFLTSNGTSVMELFSGFAWMRDTFLSNELYNSVQKIRWTNKQQFRLTLSFNECTQCSHRTLQTEKWWIFWLSSTNLQELTAAEKPPLGDTVELRSSIRFWNHLSILSMSHVARRASAVTCKSSR